jgi:signal transduction histidine kinase
MSLKIRFSILFSLFFSIILGAVLLFVFESFSAFRRDEFRDRLAERAQTTVKLLVEVQEVDYQLLRVIDRNTINNLYNEKVLIFNDSLKLIYSSIDDANISYTDQLLNEVQRDSIIFIEQNGNELLGLDCHINSRGYIVLVSANDKYGNRKLTFLRNTLVASFVIAVSMVLILSFYFSKAALRPLDLFKQQIQEITENNLDQKVELPRNNDEITQLATVFNLLMERIQKTFSFQRNFIHHASHEIRTPLSKITAITDNLIVNQGNPEYPTGDALGNIRTSADQLSEVLSSLLLISRLNRENDLAVAHRVRIDEVIFFSIEYLKTEYPGIRVQFDIEIGEDTGGPEIRGDESLLRIMFRNVIKNAFIHSDNGLVNIYLSEQGNYLLVRVENSGRTPDSDRLEDLFEPFVRGTNVQEGSGHGLGLSIVKRIVEYHGARVRYEVPFRNVNRIAICFFM